MNCIANTMYVMGNLSCLRSLVHGDFQKFGNLNFDIRKNEYCKSLVKGLLIIHVKFHSSGIIGTVVFCKNSKYSDNSNFDIRKIGEKFGKNSNLDIRISE